MEKTPNNYMAVAYELYVTEDGTKEQVEKAPAERPFQFITGMGATLDCFERELKELQPGAKFEFTIPMAEAYGTYRDDLVVDLDKHIFEIDGKFDAEHIVEGNLVPLMSADGTRMQGTVAEVKEHTVTVDLNHPLAGADLTFVGEVLENRPATVQEMQHMANMLSGEGCGGCGGSCGDGDCDGGCGGCGHCH